jgi:hypothetical protein
MYTLFSGDWVKNYQLRVLGKFREQLKRASRHPMAMHASSNLPSMRTKKWVH